MRNLHKKTYRMSYVLLFYILTTVLFTCILGQKQASSGNAYIFFLFLNAQDDRTSPLKRLDPSCSQIMSRCSYVDTKTRENEIRVNNLISSSFK